MREFLARLGRPSGATESRHLGVLRTERRGGGLAAGVGINLRIQHEHLDVEARHHHARQRLEPDVVHRSVAADDPQPPPVADRSHRTRIPMASAGAFSNSELVHGTWYGLKGYVVPNTVLQPVAATIPIDRTVDLGGCDQHSERRRFPASRARAGTAGVASMLAEHQVAERLLIDEPRGVAGVTQQVHSEDFVTQPVRRWAYPPCEGPDASRTPRRILRSLCTCPDR